jgi:hypothetical protein
MGVLIIPSPTKLRRGIVTNEEVGWTAKKGDRRKGVKWEKDGTSSISHIIPQKKMIDMLTCTVRPCFRNILVNILESTSFNGF